MAVINVTKTSNGEVFSLNSVQIIDVQASGSGSLLRYYNDAAILTSVTLDEAPSAISTAAGNLFVAAVSGGNLYINANEVIVVVTNGTGCKISYDKKSDAPTIKASTDSRSTIVTRINSASGSSSVIIETQTAYVNQDTGNDATAVLGDITKPFLTITAALAVTPYICITSLSYMGADDITSQCQISSIGAVNNITVNSISAGFNLLANTLAFVVAGDIIIPNSSFTVKSPTAVVSVGGNFTIGNGTDPSDVLIIASQFVVSGNFTTNKAFISITLNGLFWVLVDFSINGLGADPVGLLDISNITAKNILFTGTTQKPEFKNNSLTSDTLRISARLINAGDYGFTVSNWQGKINFIGDYISDNLTSNSESAFYLDTDGAHLARF